VSADVLERVAERVYRIRERFVNLYVIDVGRIVLVDTGTKGAEPLVREALKELGKELADIRLVLLTHHHLDHVGTAGVWKREAKSTVLVHDDDADVVAGRERRKGKGIGLRAKTLIAFAGVFAWSMRVPPLEPDRRLTGHETIDLLGLPAVVIHVPGHTIGSCAFHLPTEGVLFAGDAVNAREGVPRPPTIVEDAEEARRSFDRLLGIGSRTLCPGHGNPVRSRWKLRSALRSQVPSSSRRTLCRAR